MKHNYIICMYNDRYEVVGPFATTADLIVFGIKWQADNDDRPTWQSIYLDDARILPNVMTSGGEKNKHAIYALYAYADSVENDGDDRTADAVRNNQEN